MEMTQFQKNLVRMWDSLRSDVYKGAGSCGGVSCAKCPFVNTVCHNNANGVLFNAEKAIEIVAGWAKEHPIVTMRDKYKEVFGAEPVLANGGLVCPSDAGLSDCNCTKDTCGDCKTTFWGSEYKPPKADEERVSE